MTCPKCQAKMLPVDGEMFCLQCGTAVKARPGENEVAPAVEDTTDPLLRKAIEDIVGHPMTFRQPASPSGMMRSMGSVLSTGVVAVAGGAATLGKAAAPKAAQPAEATPEVAAEQPARPEAVDVVAAALKAVPVAKVATAVSRGPTLPVARPASALVTPVIAATSAPLLGKPAPIHRSWGWITIASVVFAIIAVLIAINFSIQAYFGDRVYPGVHVGETQLGGLALADVHQKLANIADKQTLTVVIGTTKISIPASELTSAAGLNRSENQVAAAGHEAPVAILGLIQSAMSPRGDIKLQPDLAAARVVARRLASAQTSRAREAVPIVYHGRAFVVGDAAGRELDVDRAGGLLAGALGHEATVRLEPAAVGARAGASTYASQIDDAQTKLGLAIVLEIEKKPYQVSADQLGSWLRFTATGVVATVDPAAVTAYVVGLPGAFDRPAVVSAIIDAVNRNQNVRLVAPRTVKSLPKTAPVAVTAQATYSYCTTDQQLKESVSSTLDELAGWSLGGRLKFVPGSSDCNFDLKLMKPENLAAIDVACERASTCVIDNQLIISEAAWAGLPAGWKGDLASYRRELINHVVGEWLGFEHASCRVATPTPISAPAAVTITGCSPSWYPARAETGARPAAF